jgi:hypothetical protein
MIDWRIEMNEYESLENEIYNVRTTLCRLENELEQLKK